MLSYSRLTALSVLCGLVALFGGGCGDVLKTFEDCGSTGTIKEVRINPCPAMPCQLKKNTTAGLEIDFQTKESAASLKITMYGVLIKGMPGVRWNGVDEQACANITDGSGHTLCPITDGNQLVSYKNSFFVSPFYPSLPVTLKIEVANPESPEKKIVCITFPVAVVG